LFFCDVFKIKAEISKIVIDHSAVLLSAVLLMVVNALSANKNASLKIDELKKYDDERLDKGKMPEESDFVLVAFLYV